MERGKKKIGMGNHKNKKINKSKVWLMHILGNSIFLIKNSFLTKSKAKTDLTVKNSIFFIGSQRANKKSWPQTVV